MWQARFFLLRRVFAVAPLVAPSVSFFSGGVFAVAPLVASSEGVRFAVAPTAFTPASRTAIAIVVVIVAFFFFFLLSESRVAGNWDAIVSNSDHTPPYPSLLLQ
jgi:hypothetical protein